MAFYLLDRQRSASMLGRAWLKYTEIDVLSEVGLEPVTSLNTGHLQLTKTHDVCVSILLMV